MKALHVFYVLLVASAFARRHSGNSVALCLTVRNQAADMKEWIDYHHNIGISKYTLPPPLCCIINNEQMTLPLDRFYIMDNNSSDALTSVLASYMQTGCDAHFYIQYIRRMVFVPLCMACVSQTGINAAWCIMRSLARAQVRTMILRQKGTAGAWFLLVASISFLASGIQTSFLSFTLPLPPSQA